MYNYHHPLSVIQYTSGSPPPTTHAKSPEIAAKTSFVWLIVFTFLFFSKKNATSSSRGRAGWPINECERQGELRTLIKIHGEQGSTFTQTAASLWVRCFQLRLRLGRCNPVTRPNCMLKKDLVDWFWVIYSMNGQILLHYQSVCVIWPDKGRYTWVEGGYNNKYIITKYLHTY